MSSVDEGLAHLHKAAELRQLALIPLLLHRCSVLSGKCICLTACVRTGLGDFPVPQHTVHRLVNESMLIRSCLNIRMSRYMAMA